MNLYQKLIEVRKSAPILGKENKGHQYQYVSSAQTLIALRGAMDDHGVLLIPEISGHTTSEKGKQMLTELDIRFRWLNAEKPDETIECPWYGQGLDSGEKGVGKALTYAEKYFLLKFFNIPTEKDDPDRLQAAERKIRNPVSGFHEKVLADGFSLEDLADYIKTRQIATKREAKELECLMAENYESFKKRFAEFLNGQREPGQDEGEV